MINTNIIDENNSFLNLTDINILWRNLYPNIILNDISIKKIFQKFLGDMKYFDNACGWSKFFHKIQSRLKWLKNIYDIFLQY